MAVRLPACLLAVLFGGLALLQALAARNDGTSGSGGFPWVSEPVLRSNDLAMAQLARSPEGRAEVERDALQRLAVEPLSARALRQLGSMRALAGEDESADRLHSLAEEVSRRDLGTQLWLIERASQQGDLGAALRHYDVALTVEPGSGELLFPVLAAAIEDDAVRTGLVPYVRADRPWVRSFLAKALVEAPPAAVADLVTVASDRARKAVSAPLLARLVDEGDFATARRLLRSLGVPLALAVDDTSTDPRLGPFAWTLARSDGVDVVRDGDGMLIRVRSGASGLAARRTLLLPPGSYRLGYSVRSVSGATGASLKMEARCLGEPLSAAKPEAIMRATDAGAAASHDLYLPPGCGALALAFHALGGDGQQEEVLRLDRLALDRLVER